VRISSSLAVGSLAARSAVISITAALLALTLVGSGITGGRLLAADGLTYKAVLLHGGVGHRDEAVDVVLVGTDGSDQIVRKIRPVRGASLDGFGIASPGGWLALSGSVGVVDTFFLYDLEHPEIEPRAVPYNRLTGVAWGPGDLFATTCFDPTFSTWRGKSRKSHIRALPKQDTWACTGIQVVDARTGTTTFVEGINLPGSGPDIIWSTDGSGILSYGDLSGGEHQTREDQTLGVMPLDGGPRELLVSGPYPHWYPRWIAEPRSTDSGRTVSVWGPGQCPGCGDEATAWYQDTLAPAQATDSVFAADGQSLWLLLIGGAKDELLLARMPQPGLAEVVSTTTVGSGAEIASIGYIAPDDSVLMVWVWRARSREASDRPADRNAGEVIAGRTSSLLLPTNGEPATTIEGRGRFAGFVTAAVAERLGGT
jgi:hypothetical protein